MKSISLKTSIISMVALTVMLLGHGVEAMNETGIEKKTFSFDKALSLKRLEKQKVDLVAKACQGDESAQNVVISLFYDRTILTINPKQVNLDNWPTLKEKVKSDYQSVLFVLVMFDSDTCKSKFPTLIPQLMKDAKEGNAEAQYCLGVAYERGRCVARDASKGHEWIKKAALQGSALAQYRIARGETDPAKKVWLERAADKGCASAQNSLSAYYGHARVEDQNIEKSIELSFKASEKRYLLSLQYLKDLFPYQSNVSLEKDEQFDVSRMSEEIASIVTNNKMKAIVNSPNEIWSDCKFAIPQIIPLYQETSDIADELWTLLKSLDQAKPGLMVKCVKASTEVTDKIAKQAQTSFVDIYHLGVDEYVTFGYENVKTARNLFQNLEGMKKKIKRADKNLERILWSLQPLEGLIAAQSEAVKSQEGSEWFFQEKERAKKIETANASQIEDIKKQRLKLAEAKAMLIDYIPKGVGARNKAFLDEYGFFKED